MFAGIKYLAFLKIYILIAHMPNANGLTLSDEPESKVNQFAMESL